MLKQPWTLALLVLLAGCTDEPEDAGLEDTEALDDRDIERPEAACFDARDESGDDGEAVAGCGCVDVVMCSLHTGWSEPVLECDLPPLEPSNPLEPWNPIEVEPQLDRIATAPGSTSSIPWPPPGCHVVYEEIVHPVVCEASCQAHHIETCFNLVTATVYSTTSPYRRPEELVDCYVEHSYPCSQYDTCD